MIISKIILKIETTHAFDTVHHGILVNMLEKYGIRGIAKHWLVSYFTDRQHYVSVNNIISNFHDVNCGVPQGYILGPLLVNI
jgi:hypothetical protein